MIPSYTCSKAQKRFETVTDVLLPVPNSSLSLHYTKNYGVRLDVHFESIRGW